MKTLDFYISLMTVGSFALAIGSIVEEWALAAIKPCYRVYSLNHRITFLWFFLTFYFDAVYTVEKGARMHMWILIQVGRIESCEKVDETIVSKFYSSCVWGMGKE